jgi:hypothetical protein
MVIHKSNDKIEFDQFLEPKDKRYTQEEFDWLLSLIEKKFNKQKEYFLKYIENVDPYIKETLLYNLKDLNTYIKHE